MVLIDRGELAAIAGLAGAATGAVERLNNRVVAGHELWRCTAALIATGEPAEGCPPAD